MIVLGIDAGASKTHAVLASDRGEVLGVGEAGSANWELVGLDAAREALHAAVDQAVGRAAVQSEDIQAGGIGLAGLDWPRDEARLRPVVDSLNIGGPYVMVNDAFLVLRAGTRDGVGLGAVAGSGSVVVGRNKAGRTERSLGAGYPFTDWGGAGDIAAAAVHAVALASMGMGPETTLAERMLKATNCEDRTEMLEKLMRWQISIGGEFAPQVFEAAEGGDDAAASIVRRVGRSIGENVVSVAKRLEMLDTAFPLVTAGGIFSSKSDLLQDSLVKTVRAMAGKFRVVHWSSPPVVGALLLAFDQLNLKSLPDKGLLATQVDESLAVSKE